MEKIKVGDFVRMKHFPFEGQICQITSIKGEGMYLTDRCSLCTDAHFGPIDPKTAFLHDLSELLRKYNAEIDAECYGSGGENPMLTVTFGDNTIQWTQGYCYNKDFGFPLTADNVFNYDK